METLGVLIGYGLIVNGLFMFAWAYKIWYDRRGNDRRKVEL